MATLLLLAAGTAAGYYWALQRPEPAPAATVARKPLYYRHPMNPKVTSPTPAKDEMGMDYTPVYGEDGAPPNKGRILYYRHPMGAADTSPVPKKDEMGMDYLPVYEGETNPPGQVSISPERIQKLGVRTEPVGVRKLTRTIRALGSIQVDERRIHSVNAKFEGWIRKLRVNATGVAVRRGEALAEVYSPELVSAQEEYLLARSAQQALGQGSEQARTTAARLADSALERLRYWDIGKAQLEALRERGELRDNLTLTSPAQGVVLEKGAVEGMRFMPGETLFRIADLRQVWLMADLYEQDLDWAREGQAVDVHIKAFPGRHFSGRIGFIQPTLETATRTAKLRIELANPGGDLKPGLYGSADLDAGAGSEPVLVVPDAAVIDSGTRQLVLVETGEGRFQARPVNLGRQAQGHFEVLQGLAEGERVVTRANFLIDAESQLKSALDQFDAADPPAAATPAPHPGHHVESGQGDPE